MDNRTITNICRACLSETGDLKSVFVSDDNSGYSKHLSEMIMACASVQIIFGDGLPEQVCLTCAEQTVKMYLFKLKCEESDKMLRERLERSPLQEICNIGKDKYSEYIEMNGCNGTDMKLTIKSDITFDEPHVDDLIDDKIQVTFGLNETEINGSDSATPILGGSEFGKKEFKCEICSKTLCNQWVLNAHIKTHSSIKEFECETCNKQFRRKDHLVRHQISHANKMDDSGHMKQHNKVTCHLCTKKFTHQWGLKAHIKTHSGIKEFECETCNKQFGRKDHLLQHKVSHAKKIDDSKHMKQHNKVSSNISCQLCTKKFRTQALLNSHLCTHSKPHICSTCNRGFLKLEQLSEHMKVHSVIKQHICNICSRGFRLISHLNMHRCIPNGEKPFSCSICHKGFNHRTNWRVHMNRHNGNKPFLCSTCGHSFVLKEHLLVHLRKHTGERPFVCPICSRAFTTSSALKNHERIHSGEKPYECDVCKKKFSTATTLCSHKRIHSGEKPYVCKICAKAFCQSGQLKVHMVIHTGEKSYICDVCGLALGSIGGLKKHKKRKHLKNTGIAGTGNQGDGANDDVLK